MKAKKPDRFERMVSKGFSGKVYRPQDLITAHDAVKLLRKEHQWMVRMVEGLRVFRIESGPLGCEYYIKRSDILDQLKKRAT